MTHTLCRPTPHQESRHPSAQLWSPLPCQRASPAPGSSHHAAIGNQSLPQLLPHPRAPLVSRPSHVPLACLPPARSRPELRASSTSPSPSPVPLSRALTIPNSRRRSRRYVSAVPGPDLVACPSVAHPRAHRPASLAPAQASCTPLSHVLAGSRARSELATKIIDPAASLAPASRSDPRPFASGHHETSGVADAPRQLASPPA